ncbi:MAG TPA: GIY-YIG nuclease family protein, partial [Gemmatimonadales bacterium]|nr:GIY-YIG nuclease family protein [Gemmatimonadales bacterium]
PRPFWSMARTYFVYILSSETRELYIGVTNNLGRRLAEHRSGCDPGSYSVRRSTTQLVYFEMTSDVSAAIRREKRLKRLSRMRKMRLIEKVNPDWRDLAGGEGAR